ncbi:MAG: hypothetical protein HC920_11635 [Oscillatoriales cyanobacterium SM2_3_0]|nr:hypothetical protein [Oscillatoriales cyanobacterium SM2_3_0]
MPYRILTLCFLGIASLGAVQPALSLPDTEADLFREAYLEGCQQGIDNFGIDQQLGENYCNCTVEKILQIPGEKLADLGTMSQEEIMQDPEIQQAVFQCIGTLQPPKTDQNPQGKPLERP